MATYSTINVYDQCACILIQLHTLFSAYIHILLHDHTYIEEYFFTRIDAGRGVCIPGHGQHLTGLGHVKDLATGIYSTSVCTLGNV